MQLSSSVYKTNMGAYLSKYSKWGKRGGMEQDEKIMHRRNKVVTAMAPTITELFDLFLQAAFACA